MSTFRCEFLGCKVNQYDAERARRLLLEQGWSEVEDGASLLLLAGCTVTANAARRGRQAVRSHLKRAPQAKIAVLGCLSEEDRRFYTSLGPGVTQLTSARSESFLQDLAPIVHAGVAVTDVAADTTRTAGNYLPRRTRTYLKVEDGCDLKCAYCIIPSIRGRARSRHPAEIERELRAVLDRGAKEVVLTGVHLGHYGRRTDWNLADLLERLLAVPGDWRMRLSSLEVTELGRGLFALLEGHPRLVPHLHLPLQSGSPRILRRMRRPYTAERFRRTVDRLRERLDDPAITTDVIVGFPGETDADFEETLAMVRQAQFSKIHTFPFSPREGTDAATLPDPVHGLVVQERKKLLFAAEQQHRDASLNRRLGTLVEVVVERADDRSVLGTDERYHRTSLPPDLGIRPGELVRAQVESVEDGRLIASPVDARSASAGERVSA